MEFPVAFNEGYVLRSHLYPASNYRSIFYPTQRRIASLLYLLKVSLMLSTARSTTFLVLSTAF